MGNKINVTVLGSGTSTGVPVIACRCAVCSSKVPQNKRSRASIMLTFEDGQHLVIDTGPDFREQMLRERVIKLGHVIYTHSHADHTHGFDDLRAFYFQENRAVSCYVPRPHLEDFRRRFLYAFENTGYHGTKPQVNLIAIDEGEIQILGHMFEVAYLPHGHMQVAAYKVGRFAYATDFKGFPSDLIKKWRGEIDVMVASGVHFREHATHNNIYQTMDLFKQLHVKRGILSHLGHEVDFHEHADRLLPGCEFAYDGMGIDVNL